MDALEKIKKELLDKSGGKVRLISTEYSGVNSRLILMCDTHGGSEISARELSKSKLGCVGCNKDKRMEANRLKFETLFISNIDKMWVNKKYDLSNMIFTVRKNPIIVGCIKHGISFETTPNDMLRSKNTCPKCKIECLSDIHIEHEKPNYDVKTKIVNSNETIESFIEKFRTKWAEDTIERSLYTFEKSIYVHSQTKMIVTCPYHGYFDIKPNGLMYGYRCMKCARKRGASAIAIISTLTQEEFEEKIKLIHGGKVGTSKAIYKGNKVLTEFDCLRGSKTHDTFFQIPNSTMSGNGCPTCSYEQTTSVGELEMLDYVKSIYSGEVIGSCRSEIKTIKGNPEELDVFIPDLKLAFEYNGMHWHSEDILFETRGDGKNHHHNKMLRCSDKGIRLVYIWEDDWNNRLEQTKNFIKGLILKDHTRFYARKLVLKEVSLNEQEIFLNNNHFQGYVVASHCLGLYHNDELIQLMSLKKLKNDEYEIGRLCTKGGNAVVGGSERLFKALKLRLNNNWSSIISYNNLDKFTGDIYGKLGMTYVGVSQNFFYSDNHIKISRQKLQKHKLIKSGISDVDEDGNKLTGDQMVERMGYSKCYTAGNSKFIIINK